jgi:hypothetical protein
VEVWVWVAGEEAVVAVATVVVLVVVAVVAVVAVVVAAAAAAEEGGIVGLPGMGSFVESYVEDIDFVEDAHLLPNVAELVVAVQVGGSDRSSAWLVEAVVTELLKLPAVT